LLSPSASTLLPPNSDALRLAKAHRVYLRETAARELRISARLRSQKREADGRKLRLPPAHTLGGLSGERLEAWCKAWWQRCGRPREQAAHACTRSWL
jgi:hypothetical protein